jgi:hypothetical protein
MRILLISLLAMFSVNAQAKQNDEIVKLAQIKAQNYITAQKFYTEQKNNLVTGKISTFCTRSEEIYKALFSILEDDLKLVDVLFKSENEDYIQYGKHLDENSRSDLFAFYSYVERCKKRNEMMVDELIASIDNSFINLKFLIYTHKLWQEALK